MKIWIDRLLLVSCMMIASQAASLQAANIVQNGASKQATFRNGPLLEIPPILL
jgi:hypothetical protein